MAGHRLPSIVELERNNLNAGAIIEARHRDTQAEFEGLENRSIFTADGRPRSYHLRLVKNRMRRIRQLADHCKVNLSDAA